MGQCLLIHTAEIVRAALMAAFAPAGTVTQAVVVIHSLSRKTGCARVTGIAVQACAGQQLRLVGNVVDRLAQSRTTLVVAGGTGTRGDPGVAECCTSETREILVTGITRSRGDDVISRFAQRVPLGVRPVVTGAALSGGDTLRRGVCEA